MPGNISISDASAARAWFANVVEPLADSFDPANVDRYVHLFAEVIERVIPELSAGDLIRRYQRVRQPRNFSGDDPEHVFVLSRVTLGADIAVTSVLLDAAKRRFPHSKIWFVGSRKGFEMFGADPRIEHAPASYERTGSVRDRILASHELSAIVERPRAIVIDPDSRLTQLGLVPVCPDEQYFFFESRASEERGTLSELAGRWVERTFDIRDAHSYLAPPQVESLAAITVSLGVGENFAKRVPDPFERSLMTGLAAPGRLVLVDQGAGGEESERVTRATSGLSNVHLFKGAFAAFAGHISASTAYIGYDSAGQHAAAACGVSLVAIFAGYPNERFIERWRPSGRGRIEVLRSQNVDPIRLASEVLSITTRYLK